MPKISAENLMYLRQSFARTEGSGSDCWLLAGHSVFQRWMDIAVGYQLKAVVNSTHSFLSSTPIRSMLDLAKRRILFCKAFLLSVVAACPWSLLQHMYVLRRALSNLLCK